MAFARKPTQGVVRIAGVYTPPTSASGAMLQRAFTRFQTRCAMPDSRCILYTDLANPISNSNYRRIGYRAVAQGLRYRFE